MKHRPEAPRPRYADRLARRMAKCAAVVAVLALFAPITLSDAYASGVGKIRAVAAQLLEELGITSGGVYSGGSGDLSAVAEDVIPDADNTRDLGSPTKAWALGYFDYLFGADNSGLAIFGGDGETGGGGDLTLAGGQGRNTQDGGDVILRAGAVDGAGAVGKVLVRDAYETYQVEVDCTANDTLELTGDLVPDADSTRDLGSATKAWAMGYVDTVWSTRIQPQGTGSGGVSICNGGGSALFTVNQNFDSTACLVDNMRLGFGSGRDVLVQGELVSGIADATTTTVLTVSTGSGDYAFVTIDYGLYFAASGEVCQENGRVQFSLCNDATSGRSAGTPGEVSVQNVTSGESLTTTWTIDTSADAMLIRLNADATMDGGSPGPGTLRYVITYSGDVSLSVP